MAIWRVGLFLLMLAAALAGAPVRAQDSADREDARAVAAMADGRYADAERYARRALERRGGSDPALRARSLGNVASIIHMMGRFEEADGLFRQALDLRIRALGEWHAEVALTLANLATNLDAMGRFGDAEAMHRRVIVIERRVLGADDPRAALSLGLLAGNLQNQKRLDEAEPLLRQALALQRRVLGTAHPATLVTLNNLSFVRFEQRAFADAEALAGEAVRASEALRAGHPLRAKPLKNLAVSQAAQGRYDGARATMRRAVALVDAMSDADAALLHDHMARLELLPGGSPPAALAEARRASALLLQRTSDIGRVGWIGDERRAGRGYFLRWVQAGWAVTQPAPAPWPGDPKFNVTAKASGRAMAGDRSAPGEAPSVEDYLCTFAGKCDDGEPAFASLDIELYPTKGFSLTRAVGPDETLAFAAGKAALDRDALSRCNNFAERPLADRQYIELVGHAGDAPAKKRKALASRRAEAVRACLIGAGVPLDRVKVKAEPEKGNDASGKVTLRITRPVPVAPKAPVAPASPLPAPGP